MVQSVIAGVDGSPESVAAARWAAGEALRRERPLRLVLAWPWLFNAPPTVRDSDTGLAQEMLLEIESGLRGDFPGLEVSADRIADHPAEVLVAAAEGAELLVLGSRGLGAVAGFLVGSVGLQVLARAACPVVLVRSGEGAPEVRGANGTGEVVLGMELERPCDEVVEFAFQAAARSSARLRAVHTWSLPSTYGYAAAPLSVDLTTSLAKDAEQALAAALHPWREKYPQVEAVEQVMLGSAGQVLAEAAAQGAALLVVGRRVRTSPVGMHVGPVAHAVLHHARCPVAVVPHP
ncbi:universal stress protein [Peterkaempfera bronchialis]|uniref:Universal stress protein n=1 Tax=Peterkaempfera bronchialis TaxID=2126346 RepID=A0A345SZ99_9ACTN|nr:universal stress protein [Peterkaempfera bronchialis]AXI79054.1 universal stress protein [Peterkaempfera bronchialis]